MIDKKSKDLINFLSKCPEHQFLYCYDYPDNFGEPDEFFATVRYLEGMGMVEIITNQQGNHIGVRLSHIAMNQKEFKRLSAIEYLKNNWIAILALIISIIAFIRSF